MLMHVFGFWRAPRGGVQSRAQLRGKGRSGCLCARLAALRLAEALHKEIRHVQQELAARGLKFDIGEDLLGVGNEVERVPSRVLDGPGFLKEVDGPLELGGVGGASMQQVHELIVAACIAQRVHGNKGALALGDVAAEVLVIGLGLANEVEQVVLDLERQTGLHAKAAQGLDLLLGASAHDGAAGQGAWLRCNMRS